MAKLLPDAGYALLANLNLQLLSLDVDAARDRYDLRMRMRDLACMFAAPYMSDDERRAARLTTWVPVREHRDATLAYELVRALDEVRNA